MVVYVFKVSHSTFNSPFEGPNPVALPCSFSYVIVGSLVVIVDRRIVFAKAFAQFRLVDLDDTKVITNR